MSDRLYCVASTPEDFKAFIGKELTKNARIVKDSGAKVD